VENFDSFIAKAIKEIGFDALRDGLMPFGVRLVDGR
jgi:hypothetical protein